MEPKPGRALTRAPGTLRGSTHSCGYCVGLRSGGICWALTAVALPSSPPPGDPWALPPRSLDPISSGSRRPRPRPIATGTRLASFPRGKAKVAGGRGVARGHPAPLLAYMAKPTYRETGNAGREVPAAALHALPRSRSPSAGSGTAPSAAGDAGEWRGAPPCSRRESRHRAGDRSFVARTPVGRAALRPGYRFLCSCPARKTQPCIGGKGLLSDLPKVLERAVTKQLTSVIPGCPPHASLAGARTHCWSDAAGSPGPASA